MTILIMSGIKKLYTKEFGNPSAIPWLPLIAILFDDSTSVPRQIEKRHFYRTIFSVWGLVAILLTNCYSGLLISELNAPLRGNRPETWQDLFCNRTYVHLVSNVQYPLEVSEWKKLVQFQKLYESWWDQRGLLGFINNNCFRLFDILKNIKSPDFPFVHSIRNLERLFRGLREGTHLIRKEDAIHFFLGDPLHANLERKCTLILTCLSFRDMLRRKS